MSPRIHYCPPRRSYGYTSRWRLDLCERCHSCWRSASGCWTADKVLDAQKRERASKLKYHSGVPKLLDLTRMIKQLCKWTGLIWYGWSHTATHASRKTSHQIEIQWSLFNFWLPSFKMASAILIMGYKDVHCRCDTKVTFNWSLHCCPTHNSPHMHSRTCNFMTFKIRWMLSAKSWIIVR